MRNAWVIGVVFAVGGGCRGDKTRAETNVLALSIRTNPPGARVIVNRIDAGWVTPCEVSDPTFRRGWLALEIRREGYETMYRRVRFDGKSPSQVDLPLVPLAPPAAGPPLVPPQPPKPAEAERPPEAARVQEQPHPGPPKGAELPKVVEPPKAAGTALGSSSARVRSQGDGIRVFADDKLVAEFPGRTEEEIVVGIPPGRIQVEFLDAKTGAVTRRVVVEGASGTASAAPPPPAVPQDPARIGTVQLVHHAYGVFVRLEEGLDLQPGEEIGVYREGREVGRAQVLRVTGPDSRYPNGSAMLSAGAVPVMRGDEARRVK